MVLTNELLDRISAHVLPSFSYALWHEEHKQAQRDYVRAIIEFYVKELDTAQHSGTM